MDEMEAPKDGTDDVRRLMLTRANNEDIPIKVRRVCLRIVEDLDTVEAWERRSALRDLRGTITKEAK